MAISGEVVHLEGIEGIKTGKKLRLELSDDSLALGYLTIEAESIAGVEMISDGASAEHRRSGALRKAGRLYAGAATLGASELVLRRTQNGNSWESGTTSVLVACSDGRELLLGFKRDRPLAESVVGAINSWLVRSGAGQEGATRAGDEISLNPQLLLTLAVDVERFASAVEREQNERRLLIEGGKWKGVTTKTESWLGRLARRELIGADALVLGGVAKLIRSSYFYPKVLERIRAQAPDGTYITEAHDTPGARSVIDTLCRYVDPLATFFDRSCSNCRVCYPASSGGPFTDGPLCPICRHSEDGHRNGLAAEGVAVTPDGFQRSDVERAVVVLRNVYCAAKAYELDDHISVRSQYSLAIAMDRLIIMAPENNWPLTVLNLADILALEIGGPGRVTTGKRFGGGGFGVEGAVAGLAVASVLTALSQRSSVTTTIHIEHSDNEYLFVCSSATPTQLEALLDPVLRRHRTFQRRQVSETPEPAGSPKVDGEVGSAGADIAGQLGQLATLRESGVLSDSEFQAAKDRILGA